MNSILVAQNSAGYRAGVVGLGHQATTDHLPGLQRSHFAQLAAVCDLDETKVQERASALGVRGYTDYHDMLDSEGLDFVVVATPHHTHKEIVEVAARHGVHVLKEKPFARNIEEAKYLTEVCTGQEIHLMIASQRRFNPIYMSFVHLKDNIGHPFLVEARYTFYIDRPGEGWRGSREQAGGGCIVDMGYHMIDMIVWNFGLPDRVLADFSSSAQPNDIYDAEDTAIILFGYDSGPYSGLYGSLTLSRYLPPKTEWIKVVGSHGIIEVDSGSLHRLTSAGEVMDSLVRQQSFRQIAAVGMIDYFCRVLRGERENVGSPADHLQHMRFIDACYRSHTVGAYVNPKEGELEL